jgi:hypothetical protein
MPKNKTPLYVETVAVTPMEQNQQRPYPTSERIGIIDVRATPVDLHAGEMCGESD